jgi:hypothetical protein
LGRFIKKESAFLRRKHGIEEDGGGTHRIAMYGLQTEKLHDEEEQADIAGKTGAEEVLPV